MGMENSKMWMLSMIDSCMIILLGILEVIGLWSVSVDPVKFGIGIMLTGGVLLCVSAYGWYETRMDEIQEIIDNFLMDAYMPLSGR